MILLRITTVDCRVWVKPIITPKVIAFVCSVLHESLVDDGGWMGDGRRLWTSLVDVGRRIAFLQTARALAAVDQPTPHCTAVRLERLARLLHPPRQLAGEEPAHTHRLYTQQLFVLIASYKWMFVNMWDVYLGEDSVTLFNIDLGDMIYILCRSTGDI